MAEMAEHGLRQKGKSTIEGKRTLVEGDTFVSLRYPNRPITKTIPVLCIGIVHDDPEEGISVIWEQSQAARRWRARVSVEVQHHVSAH